MQGRSLLSLAFALLTLLVLGAACGSDSPEPEPGPQPPTIVYAMGDLPEPTANWLDPAAVAVGPSREIWVVDSGLDRIVELNLDGEVVRVLCETDECRLALKNPQGIAYHQGSLYVANSGEGTVVVLSLTGKVERTIEIAKGPAGAAEPTDVVVADNGEIYVSDPVNDRVLHLGATGGLIEILQTTDPTDRRYTFKEPRGLAFDQEGNLYVANAADGSVKKYSPEGRFLQEFLANVPTLTSPLDIAIGPDGTVYFSDGKSGFVQAFTAGGQRLTSVGYFYPTRADSPLILREPEGLAMSGNLLFVADHREGVFAFEMDPAYWVKWLERGQEGTGGTSPWAGHESER